jgi:excisionase family DNA binding protein
MSPRRGRLRPVTNLPRATPPAPAQPAGQLITTAEAAARLGIHPRTLRDWISAGILHGYRVGPKNLRVDADEVTGLIRPLTTAERRSL